MYGGVTTGNVSLATVFISTSPELWPLPISFITRQVCFNGGGGCDGGVGRSLVI